MSTEVDEPRDRRMHGGRYAHDSGWELPELAPATIIVSVGLLVVGSGIATWMSFVGQVGFPARFGWSVVTSALRWVDPSTSTMLLIAAALIWWQYGYWSSFRTDVLSEDVIETHIVRLRKIAKWNMAAFVINVASVVLLIVGSILENTGSGGAPLEVWGQSVETICTAVGTILLSLLGVAGLQRILVASRALTRDDEWAE
jgi:hypothetical protein